MAYKYNPLLGVGLDEVGAGAGGSTSPGGANTQVQFNDNGGFGGDAGLTYNKTTDELTVAGDINLDDGGTFSTTVQSVTPTANRTISFPDATGTVALVSGSNGTIQYNDAGTLKGNSNFTVNVDWDNPSTTFTALKVNVPDTTQGAVDSNLLDLQAGGTSKFFARSSGDFGTNTAWLSSFSTGVFRVGSATSDGRGIIGLRTIVGSSGFYAFSDSNTIIDESDYDLALFRDDANILAQRNGTNAQTYRLYNTYTDASNYQRTSINDDSTGLIINQEYAGTGAVRTNLLDLQDNGVSRLAVLQNGELHITALPSPIVSSKIRLTHGNGNFGEIKTGSGGEIYVGNVYLRGIFGTRVGSNCSYGWSNSVSTGSQAADTALARDSAGVVAITDGSTGTGYVKQTPVLVSALPAAATVGAGTRGFVSDATATIFASVVTGSGTASTAGTVPVYSDGTDWRIG